MGERIRRRNGQTVERPKPLPVPTYIQQAGAILAAIGAATGDEQTRCAARNLVGDDLVYAMCARTALAMLRSNVFARHPDSVARLIAELVTLRESHNFFTSAEEALE
ncbi:hypothetical protein JDV09_18910 [Mycobacterium sp. Y57]|uniref:hypothetical protein n=1 Tax=Mycolicibacterium xanthum TaxID=2796469 RepID=UPI001C8581E3|nr:hypothetical protein [Mycolicibacterium xanthum]MBX7434170.1 hypothetical protein [Mycolicibacterium xanthum]